ncbi:MAG TPA: hypothetical protein HA300_01100, partial [Thermococcaceae archaeon]|nr:hypothetical protein [Thermococcaceae archaeon]
IAVPLLIVAHHVLSEWYGAKVGIPHGKVPIYVVEENIERTGGATPRGAVLGEE